MGIPRLANGFRPGWFRSHATHRAAFRLEVLLLAGIWLTVTALLAASEPAKGTSPFAQPLDDARRIAHAASRLTFGADAATVARIRELGVAAWVELQLNPKRIPESPKLATRLKAYPALALSTAQLARTYPNRQYLRAVSAGRTSLPADPQEKARVEAMAKVYQAQVRGLAQKAAAEARQTSAGPDTVDGQAMSLAERLISLAGMTRDERQQALRQMPASERREVIASLRPAFTVQTSLVAGKLLRAVYSERQLEELLTDFWFNHFNVSVQKEGDRYYTIPFERDAIRKHAMGRFEDLLVATAQSPAMLFYLDNFQSISPDARLPRRMAQNNRLPKGLNENYARELLELHTLGVDGGYTQRDVTEVARCFTGWTIDQRTPGGGFRFVPMLHDSKPKTVLGKSIQAGGMQDGVDVLAMLARHPSTARFISHKLAVRFVADEPPAALVGAMSDTFLRTKGDLREVMRTMLQSEPFWSEGAYRAKVKQPFEMVVSAVRALEAEVRDPLQLARTIDRLGQPLYRKQEPTGYPAENRAWVSSAALVERMNVSLALAANRMPGVRYQAPATSSGKQVVDWARTGWLLPIADDTVERLQSAIGDPAQEHLRLYRGASEAQLWTGLLLGSPEFQRK